MKRLILAFSFSLLLFVSAFSQETQKLDEFIPDNCEIALSKLDSFASDLQNKSTSKGFIVFYDGTIVRYGKSYQPTSGESKYLVESFQNYLVNARGISKNKIEIIDGGFREKNFVEFWTLPLNSKPPVPTPTLKKLTYKKRKFIKLCTAEIAPFVF